MPNSDAREPGYGVSGHADGGHSGLFVDETSIRDGVRLTVAGDLDLASADELAADLLDALDHVRVLELDLFEVGFIDSSGLKALLAASSAAVNGKEVVITHASPQVTRLLDLTGLSASFGLPSNSN